MATTTTDKAAPEVQAPPITVTEKAASAVGRYIEEQKQALAQQPGAAVPEKLFLRMRVVGGGCSGFQHKLELDDSVTDRDEVYEFHGVPVVVDRRSLMYLAGATIDFHDDLDRSGFSITNPNAKSHCGCGSSFSM